MFVKNDTSYEALEAAARHGLQQSPHSVDLAEIIAENRYQHSVRRELYVDELVQIHELIAEMYQWVCGPNKVTLLHSMSDSADSQYQVAS